ncbi:MAG: helix-turn-helix transcriptional regulator [Eubacterium sp.]|nr:helix-turn-helix transcriptional regulator [Eubacterium sp.]
MDYSDILYADNSDIHRDMKEEISFFHNVSIGNISAIKENINNRRFRDENGVGKLSKDPITNLKYHMVITAGIITRICIGNGMEPEMAFRMSDYYISLLDNAKTEDYIEKVHDDMVMDFTTRMMLITQGKNYSRPISRCLSYIYSHIYERITIKALADFSGVSESYLSRQFPKEVGISISTYIRNRKIELAQALLINSDMSILDISFQLSYSSQSHFIQAFKQVLGTTPNKFRTESSTYKWIIDKSNNDTGKYSIVKNK